MRSPIGLHVFAVVLGVGALIPSTSRAGEELRVLTPGADGTSPGEQFERWLKGELYQLIDRRTAAVEKLKSAWVKFSLPEKRQVIRETVQLGEDDAVRKPTV